MKRSLSWGENRQEIRGLLPAGGIYALLAATLDAATWQTHGVVRLCLFVPAGLFSSVGVWMLGFVGFFGFFFLAVAYPALGTVLFGLGVRSRRRGLVVAR